MGDSESSSVKFEVVYIILCSIVSLATILYLQRSAKHSSVPVVKMAPAKSAWSDWSSYIQV